MRTAAESLMGDILSIDQKAVGLFELPGVSVCTGKHLPDDGVRRDLFGYEEAVGRVLKVNQIWLEVIGVLDDSTGASTV